MSIVNLTPHAVQIVDASGKVVRNLKSEGVARASQIDSDAGDLEGVPMVRSTYGGTEGLPAPKAGVWLVVSLQTADAAKGEGRSTADLVMPAKLVRDDKGQITGARALAYYSYSVKI